MRTPWWRDPMVWIGVVLGFAAVYADVIAYWLT
jgi:hypothetical protein